MSHPEPSPSAPPIGRSLARPDAARLIAGRGRYTDDLRPPRTLHAAFLRSPVAHARIVSIDASAARALPGVIGIWSGEDLAPHVRPVLGRLDHMRTMNVAPQWPLAREHVRWAGEPVAVVAAATRAQAEDAAQAIVFEWEALAPLADPEAALAPGAPLLHPALGTNLMFEHAVGDAARTAAVFAEAAHVVAATLTTERVSAVALEPRAILADWDPAERRLVVRMGTQVPHMMQAVLARVLDLPADRIRVVAADTGGSFGSKIHGYGDELAVAALARLLGRPVKYVCDRMEAFVSDVQARGHRVHVRVALDADGRLRAFDVDDLCGAGPFSIYPRGSVNESRHVVGLTGQCYRLDAYHARTRIAHQTKGIYGQVRGVGHPLACLFTEVMVDRAARAVGADPLALRRANLLPDGGPHRALSGATFERTSLVASLDTLATLMDYRGLRERQAALRARGIHHGIGLAVFVENSNHSSANYGRGGAPIASQDGCAIRLTASGGVVCAVGLAESGQGVGTAMAQIAAGALGVPFDAVSVVLGDTLHTPVSGGNWGSRGTGIAGEALWQAARALRAQLIEAAAQLATEHLAPIDLREGVFVDAAGTALLTLAELAQAIHFRPERFPRDFRPQPAAHGHYAQRAFDGIYANGAAGSLVEVDVETGVVRVLAQWIVDDCGTVVNPLLVDEQLRGACVQGIGQALYEACLYGESGEPRNATLADYLVPMAAEMPEIVVGHVVTPTATSALGAKGAGEAGVTGALAAVVNAVNDAIAPLARAPLLALPITPERVLRALGTVD